MVWLPSCTIWRYRGVTFMQHDHRVKEAVELNYLLILFLCLLNAVDGIRCLKETHKLSTQLLLWEGARFQGSMLFFFDPKRGNIITKPHKSQPPWVYMASGWYWSANAALKWWWSVLICEFLGAPLSLVLYQRRGDCIGFLQNLAGVLCFIEPKQIACFNKTLTLYHSRGGSEKEKKNGTTKA